MSKMIDISGKKFGRWTVIQKDKSDKAGIAVWLCRCDCGKESLISGNSLRSGNSISCGCFRKENPNHKTHGQSETKVYLVWRSMIARCYNKNVIAYKDYGGRGISVCDKWRDSFENFISDMGLPPPKHTIERKNNNGNYEPENCLWASYKVQANNRRGNRIIVINGISKTMSQWSEEYGVKVGTIWSRLKNGWSPELAVFKKTE